MASTKVRDIDEVNAEVPPSSITRDEFINVIEKADHAEGTANRSLYDLNTAGFIAATNNAAKDLEARTLQAGTGISVSNGNGVSADPTISLGGAPAILAYLFDTNSKETISVSGTAIDPAIVTTILDIGGAGNTSLAAPAAAGLKLIINTNASAVTLTIPAYQVPTGKIDYTAGASFISNAALLLYGTGNGGEWHALGGYYET